MKTAISVLLVLLLVLSAVPIFASAETESTVYNVLLSGLLSFDEEIDISSFSISSDELYSILNSIYQNEPMLFYWSGRYSYSYYKQNAPVEVFPHYSMTDDERLQANEYINSVLDEVIASVPEGVGDFEKALYLHDYVCVNFEYDNTYVTYDIYNMLKNGVGVCTAYTLLYDELLTRVGIESRAVVSPQYSLNHMWNEVHIGNDWYHVDTTWDDPVPNRFGEVRHTNFLLDDDALSLTHNSDYFAEYACENAYFDLMSWRVYNSPFVFMNGNIYAVEFDTVVSFDLCEAKHELVKEISHNAWYAIDGSYLGYCIGFGGYDGRLYFNDEYTISAYDPIRNSSKTVLTVSASEGKLIGMYIFGNKLYYLVSPTGYADQGTVKTLELSPMTTELGGDANGDGALDQYDYIYVKRAYFGTLTIGEADLKRADVNKDKTLDQFDYILVKRAYFGTYSFE